VSAPPKRDVIGTAVSIVDYAGVSRRIAELIESGAGGYVCLAPASTLVFARKDEDLARALADADIVAPDGMGVVHAASLLGEQLPGRVYGPDLMELELARAVRHSIPVFLYGGFDQAALSTLEERLRERFSGLAIAGSFAPPHRELTAAERTEVVAAIRASGAKIVWVGLGSPKQEKWMYAMRAELDSIVMIGVGAAFDFLAGRVKQAPQALQSSGLEWAYRAAQEPLRLGRRYLMTLPKFVLLVILQRLRRG
jgi:N-acetylglucosaminyldiphosphoundecaprenol N-acetyl-beta-D-mannosaminyltransferase